jgi:hypothetical protein
VTIAHLQLTGFEASLDSKRNNYYFPEKLLTQHQYSGQRIAAAKENGMVLDQKQHIT